MIRRRYSMLLIVLLTVFIGCDRQQSTLESIDDFDVRFETGVVRIVTEADTFALDVEIAESEQQRNLGLMRRPTLAADSGMIFLFQQQQAPERTFWMYNTLIPLSIAFIDQDGIIGNIREMEPCASPYPQYCPYYEARVPYWMALEVNAGYFEEYGIGIGDRVILERE